MRYSHYGVFRDGNGRIIQSGTIAVFLAGTTTPATIYTTDVIVTSVNSVTSGTDGSFLFYVDTDDYSTDQLFKMILSKTGYTSTTIDVIPIIPYERDNVRYIFEYDSLADALTSIGSTPCELRITRATDVTADTTIPSTIRLNLSEGLGSFIIASGKTLTINGPFEAGLYQVFTGTGYAVFGTGSVTDIRPEWWGGSYAGLVKALASISTASKTLIISNAVTITGNMTILATTNLKVENSGMITIATGITLTINGSISAGLYRIFTYVGTGVVVFGLVSEVYPEWWGAIPDGTTTCGPAINAAIQAVTSSVTSAPGIVSFAPGRYMVEGADVIVGSNNDRGAMLVGSGRYATELNMQGGASRDGITYSHDTAYGRGGGIKDMRIWAPAISSIRDLVFLNNWGEWVMDNVILTNCGRYGLQIVQGISIAINASQLSWAAISNLSINDGALTLTTTVTCTGCYFSLATQVGVDLQGLGITFNGCVFESNGISTSAEGIRVRSGTSVFDGCYWEDNEGHDMVVGYTTPQPSWGTSVTVINPMLQGAGGHKLTGYGGFYIKRGQFNLVGPGTWLAPAATVIVDYTLDPEVNLIALPSGLTPVPTYNNGLPIGQAVYGATIPITAGSSDHFRINATNGTAFKISNPTHPKLNQRITIWILNSSGGALGIVTWDTLYKMTTWTSPATGYGRGIEFRFDGTYWMEISRSASDVSN